MIFQKREFEEHILRTQKLLADSPLDTEGKAIPLMRSRIPAKTKG